MELNLSQDPELRILYGYGQTGLFNLGNTCYLNTAIQCLSSVKIITAYFLSNQYLTDLAEQKNESKFVGEYSSLLKRLWRNNSQISPTQFKESVSIFYDVFKGKDQHDSAEAFCKIIELLHDGLVYEADLDDPECGSVYREALNCWRANYENNYSIILKFFYGQFWSRSKCGICNTVFNKFDSFSIINLPLNNKTNTLEDCLRYYVLTEDMVNDDMLNCEKCKRHCIGKRKITVWRMPPVITFCFNRFDMKSNKIDKLIDFPIGTCNFPTLAERTFEKKTMYELTAIGNHEGSLFGGHYWAVTKGTNGKWYEYDDHRVREIGMESLVSNNAYYLVYVKKKVNVRQIINS